MGGPMFDTLSYAKRLREAGVPEAQAETHAALLIEAVQENLASKQDVADLKRDIAETHRRIDSLKTELKRDIAETHGRIDSLKTGLKRDIAETHGRIDSLKTELKRDIADVHTELKRDLFVLENRMIIKLGLMLATSIAIVAAMVRLL